MCDVTSMKGISRRSVTPILKAIICGVVVAYFFFGVLGGSRRDTFIVDAPETNEEEGQGEKSIRYTVGRGVSSRDGRYMMHPHVWLAGTESSTATKVCLATQASTNRLSSLPWLIQSWNGPMSVAVYAAGPDYTALALTVKYLKMCYRDTEDRVTFHLVYPKSDKPLLVDHDVDVKQLECSEPEFSIREILQNIRVNKNDTILYFPHNVLRNLARRSCNTPYTIVIDSDMIPAPHMFERLNPLLLRQKDEKRLAFVIPVYETHHTVNKLPVNKPALLHMLREKKARIYHIQDSEKGQHSTNLAMWEKVKSSVGNEQPLFWSLQDGATAAANSAASAPYTVAYKVAGYREYYEPILVLPDDAPGWDERFRGFGNNRMSQIYELSLLNYTFVVLDDAFLTHRGYANNKPYSAARRTIREKNAKLFSVFKKELAARYSQTSHD